jgi:DNA recombination protein RmuC
MGDFFMSEPTATFANSFWLIAISLPITGFAIGYWVRSWQGKDKIPTQGPIENTAHIEQVSRLEAENKILKAQVESSGQTEDLLRMELNEASMSNARLDALLQEREQRELEERKKQTEITERFATEQVQRQQEQAALQKAQFEALSQQTLKTLKEELEAKAEREYRLKQEAMDERLSQLLKPLKEVLDENEKRVKEVEKQHLEGTTSLKTEIANIVEQTSQLVSVKNKLAEALSNSKGRGDWGELELIRLLEHSGLSEGIHYDAQRQENGLRPDITLRLSNQRILYIDAKTILVNLERLLLAGDDTEEHLQERKKHANALEKEVLSLSLKSYESKTSESIDFVVLYVPRESMLRAALEEKPQLMELAFQRRVILASPLVLMPILKVVAYGWDQAQISQKAAEIQELGKELHKRAAGFLVNFEEIGKRLGSLSESYDKAKTSFMGRRGFVPQLKKFEQAGCKSEKEIPKSLLQGAEFDDDLDGESNAITLNIPPLPVS